MASGEAVPQQERPPGPELGRLLSWASSELGSQGLKTPLRLGGDRLHQTCFPRAPLWSEDVGSRGGGEAAAPFDRIFYELNKIICLKKDPHIMLWYPACSGVTGQLFQWITYLMCGLDYCAVGKRRDKYTAFCCFFVAFDPWWWRLDSLSLVMLHLFGGW